MMLRALIPLALAASIFPAHAAIDNDFLVPRPTLGEHYSNVFSIASAIKADGFDIRVGRNSGSADYTVTQVVPDGTATYAVNGVYDGMPANDGRGIAVTRDGGATSCWNGTCRTYTDASGLIYNRLLWGDPPAHLKVGMHWRVRIPQAWELGQPGVQTVTVIRVDATEGTVTLKREGSAIGAFANEPATVELVKDGKQYTLTDAPGRARWSGYTTFRHGIVQSDELLVVRSDVLHSPQFGAVKATRRRYMLLNAAPYSTL